MNILKITLKRIAIRKLDRTITKVFKTVIESSEVDTIKDYKPQIPKIIDIFKSILIKYLIILGGMVWMGVLLIFSQIFLNINTSALISVILISALLIYLFIKEISISEVPGIKTEKLYVKDKRFKEGKRYVRDINVPDYDNMIQYSKGQNIIKFISAAIRYVLTILIYWMLYFVLEFGS
jgi:hypothetical protein